MMILPAPEDSGVEGYVLLIPPTAKVSRVERKVLPMIPLTPEVSRVEEEVLCSLLL